MKYRHIIILMFFIALIGSQFSLFSGVSWKDLFCAPLLLYVLANLGKFSKRTDIIARTSLVYSMLLILTGLLNGTITNTININFTRNFIEGVIAYLSLTVALKEEKDLIIFGLLSFLYSAVYLILNNMSISTSLEYDANFAGISSDLFGGRNGMAVTNLLLVILLTYHIYYWRIKKTYLVLLLFPFLIFNIIFSASRFSVISLAIFLVFIILFMGGNMQKGSKLFILLFAATMPYFVSLLISKMDVGVMSYSSDLLQNKLTQNEDGGFVYRLKDLNFLVIMNWLDSEPFHKWFFGDGISITHGVFSFTFCCTGIIGFLYFVITHIKMMIKYWSNISYEKYIAFSIFIFFLNDIVTNSRFIIGLNTMIYMGMLAFFRNASKMNKLRRNEDDCVSR